MRKRLANRYGLKITVISVVLALTSFGAFVFFKQYKALSSREIIATVNGEPLYLCEFQRQLQKQKSSVAQYFYEKYKTVINDKFWSGSYHGEAPLDIAKEKALSACVAIKIQQILAKKYGIQNDIDYLSFLKEWRAENDRRAQAAKHKETIFGPVQFDENVYFNDVFSKMVIRLKEALRDNTFKITGEEVKLYYDSIKSEFYQKEDVVKIHEIAFCFVDPNGNLDMTKKQQYLSKIKQVKARLDSGESFDVLASAYNEAEADKKNGGEQVFDSESLRKDTVINGKLKQEAYKLDVRGISEIFEAGNTYYIIQCVKRISNGFYPYSEVQEDVQAKYIDLQYNRLVEQLTKNAEVTKNGLYQKIGIYSMK